VLTEELIDLSTPQHYNKRALCTANIALIIVCHCIKHYNIHRLYIKPNTQLFSWPIYNMQATGYNAYMNGERGEEAEWCVLKIQSFVNEDTLSSIANETQWWLAIVHEVS